MKAVLSPLLFALVLAFLALHLLNLLLPINGNNNIKLNMNKQPNNDWFNPIFDKWFLGRSDSYGYYNKPSANLRLFAALHSTLLISIFFALLAILANTFIDSNLVAGSDGKPRSETEINLILGFLGLWFGMFWKEKKDLHDKWKYLADLYNKFLQEPPINPNIPSKFSVREPLRVALALDCLVMGMWAHKSFYEVFEHVLIDAHLFSMATAPEWKYDESNEKEYKDIYDKAKEHFLTNPPDYSFAQDLINTYHYEAVRSSRFAYMKNETKTRPSARRVISYRTGRK